MMILAAEEIEIGVHPTATFFGLTFNLDTMLATVIAGVLVVGLGLFVRARVTAGVPSGAQLFLEGVNAQVRRQVEDSVGIKTAPFVVPLAMTLFLFILTANWLAVLPSEHYVPPPTADVNLTFALALLVIGWVQVTGIRKRGAGPYFKHFAQPYWWLLPLNLIEELAKPVSLALRLFGNIFAGGIIISLIAGLPAYLLWAPTATWKLFDLFIGLIQAFIFALLTVLYFGSATSEEGH
ncbi:MAG: F0F1 ATP synthase subunit A [Geodermatophilaceae bacterium]|jgi:F-type H+-transporting ATPase subunit a|nr:F0F1 ATP synthase subunit A [Geodermatophilaceae bacterium]